MDEEATGQPEDHPRSRGVYVHTMNSRVGLSWIIPARAGFTGRPGSTTTVHKDHPRSRGVYASARSSSAPSRGSSPLARGLPAGRAGRSWAGRDHPRSRGVYPTQNVPTAIRAGSSPLARGLRLRRLEDRGVLGIIPARAGFTRVRDARHRPPADHPRSRGVYLTPSPATAMVIGSSPLARGLPSCARARAREWRIIPARAGFTSPARASRSYVRDHPRSRGVYALADALTADPWGSSPLARGLPASHGAPPPRRGIIPARAGFT